MALASAMMPALAQGGAPVTAPQSAPPTAPPTAPLSEAIDEVARDVDAMVARLDIEAIRAAVESSAGARFRVAPRVAVVRLVETFEDDDAHGELGDRIDAPMVRRGREIVRTSPPSERAFRATGVPGVTGGVRGAPVAVDPWKLRSALRAVGDTSLVDGVVAIEVARQAALTLVDERVGLARLLDDPRITDRERSRRAALVVAWTDLVAERVAATLGLEAALAARRRTIDGFLARATYISALPREAETIRLTAIALQRSGGRDRLAAAGSSDAMWGLLERPPASLGDDGSDVETCELPGVAPALVDLDVAAVVAAYARVRPAIVAAFGDVMLADLAVSACDRRSLAWYARWWPRAAPSPSPTPRGGPLRGVSALTPDRGPAVRRLAAAMCASTDPNSPELVVHLGRLSETLAEVEPAIRADVMALLLAHAASATARPHVTKRGGSRVAADSEASLVAEAVDAGHALWAMRRIAKAASLESALLAAERQTPRERERRALVVAGAGALAIETELDEFVRRELPDTFDRLLGYGGPSGEEAVRRFLETPPTTVEELRAQTREGASLGPDPLLEPGEKARRLRRLRDMAIAAGAPETFVSTSRLTREILDQFGVTDRETIEILDRFVRRVDVVQFPLASGVPGAEVIAVRLRLRGATTPEEASSTGGLLSGWARALVRRALAARGPAVAPFARFTVLESRRVPWAMAASIEGDPMIHIGVGRRSRVLAMVVCIGPPPANREIADLLDAALDRD
jgi:hypothetical protein